MTNSAADSGKRLAACAGIQSEVSAEAGSATQTGTQEQLLKLLRDHGSMAPSEIWKALDISKQGAMDLLRPLIEAGVMEKLGSKKNGRYVLRQP